MTTPSPLPDAAGLSSTISPDEARASLLAVHADVLDVVASVRRSTGAWPSVGRQSVGWESRAADRFRDDVGALLGEIDADLRLLEDVVAVLGR